jgi:hypothetical protein
MKVIKGTFGQEPEVDEEKPSLTEAILGALEHAEVSDETQGEFFLVLNTESRFTFITNEKRLGDLIGLLEVAKGTLVQQYAEDL